MTFQWRHVMRFWAKNGRQLYRSQINVYWSKSQTKGVKRQEIEFSTRWLSLIFKIFGFWLPILKNMFSGKSALKSKIFKIFKKKRIICIGPTRESLACQISNSYLNIWPPNDCNKCEIWWRHKNKSHYGPFIDNVHKNKLQQWISEMKLNQKSVFYFQIFEFWKLTLFNPFWPDPKVKS